MNHIYKSQGKLFIGSVYMKHYVLSCLRYIYLLYSIYNVYSKIQ